MSPLVKKEHPFKRVLGSHIVVRIDEFQYSGRLVIPDTAKRKPTKGTVIAKADNVDDIEIGEKILFSQFAGYLLVFEGLPIMRVLGREEVLGVLEDTAPPLIQEGS